MRAPSAATAGAGTATAQALAEAVGAAMIAQDEVLRAHGLTLEALAPGQARLAMTVRTEMLNGFRTCHGGLITVLADTAFAYACNSHNQMTVASGIAVDFLAPAHAGDRLVAEAREVALLRSTGVYDVVVTNQHGTTVAVMRGRSHAIKGRHVVPPA